MRIETTEMMSIGLRVELDGELVPYYEADDVEGWVKVGRSGLPLDENGEVIKDTRTGKVVFVKVVRDGEEARIVERMDDAEKWRRHATELRQRLSDDMNDPVLPVMTRARNLQRFDADIERHLGAPKEKPTTEEAEKLQEKWDALRWWLGYGLERLDPNRMVKVKWHTEHILKAMDRLDAGESAFVDPCGMCDEVLKRRGSK